MFRANPVGYTPHATRYNEHVCPPLYAAPSGCVVPQPVVPHRLYGTELSSSYSNNIKVVFAPILLLLRTLRITLSLKWLTRHNPMFHQERKRPG